MGQNDKLSPSMTLLRRYWLMLATYNGLAFAVVSWIMLIAICTVGMKLEKWPSPYVGFPIELILIGLVITCSREANRYLYYQAE